MDTLNHLERAVLTKMLDGDHPVLNALRQQLESCSVRQREMTGVGFCTELAVPAEVDAARTKRAHIRFGDVIGELTGVEEGVGFVLFIDDGRLQMLEGYTFGEPWPNHAKLRGLSYSSEPRDLAPLD